MALAKYVIELQNMLFLNFKSLKIKTMVLTNNQAEVTPKGYLATRDFNSFITLDSRGIQCDHGEKLFGYSIELLNSIRVISLANKMCSDFKSDFRIDTTIYHKAVDAILNNAPFSDSELENYFESEQKKEDFLKFSRSLATSEEEFYLPYEVDFLLLGINLDDFSQLNESQRDSLSTTYGEIWCDVRFKKMEIKNFILKARDLLASSFKKTICVADVK